VSGEHGFISAEDGGKGSYCVRISDLMMKTAAWRQRRHLPAYMIRLLSVFLSYIYIYIYIYIFKNE
jgi:hypothetical protein